MILTKAIPMTKKAMIVALIMTFFVSVTYAHGEGSNDGLLSTFTRTNAIILIIAAISALVYGGVIWSTLGQRSSLISLGISFLIAFAGFVHLAAGRTGDLLLIANGFGFLVFVVVLEHKAIRLSKWINIAQVILITYTSITFVGYFIVHDHLDIIGVSTKITEALLIVALLVRLVQMRMSDNSNVLDNATT